MIHLSPDTLEHTYEMLRSAMPFRRWSLPPAESIEFHVVGSKALFGWLRDGKALAVSNNKNHYLHSVVMTVAHEMCHLRLFKRIIHWERHGPEFQQLADQVCRHHGFDRGAF